MVVRPDWPAACDAWRSVPQPDAGNDGLSVACAADWMRDQPASASDMTIEKRSVKSLVRAQLATEK